MSKQSSREVLNVLCQFIEILIEETQNSKIDTGKLSMKLDNGLTSLYNELQTYNVNLNKTFIDGLKALEKSQDEKQKNNVISIANTMKKFVAENHAAENLDEIYRRLEDIEQRIKNMNSNVSNALNGYVINNTLAIQSTKNSPSILTDDENKITLLWTPYDESAVVSVIKMTKFKGPVTLQLPRKVASLNENGFVFESNSLVITKNADFRREETTFVVNYENDNNSSLLSSEISDIVSIQEPISTQPLQQFQSIQPFRPASVKSPRFTEQKDQL